MATKYLDYAGLQRLVENIDKKYAPIAALIFKQSVEDIAHLPALNTVKAGWMYDVKTGGGTTSDFVEGAGHVLQDGENVAAVELITGFVAVASVAATDDPKALGWYEVNSASAVTPATGDSPAALGWYELSGTTYVLSVDTTVDAGKTYYTVDFKFSEDRIPDAAKVYYEASTVMKWDILGGVFDLEGKYLEFGNEFPSDSRLVDGRVFLYMGDSTKVYTAVATPSGRPSENGYFEGTFTPVADPSAIQNPKQEGLYEVASTDYVQVTPVSDPAAEGLYEEDSTTPGTYIPTADTTITPGKDYFKQVITYVHSSDVAPAIGKTYFTGAFIASVDTTVDPTKVYYTEADQYNHAVIYEYDATAQDWVAQSSDNDLVPITTREIDDLFI